MSAPPTPPPHEGELAVQRRAGVEAVAARVRAGNVWPGITADFARFLADQFLLVAACAAPDGRVWASVLLGPPGFARGVDGSTVVLGTLPVAGDPLADALDAAGDAGVPVGLLALEAATRTRVRVNGRLRRADDGLVLAVEEAFGNCPKHITRRRAAELLGDGAPGVARVAGTRLTAAQAALVRGADTWFVASAHPERGADASHRGGSIEVLDDGARLRWEDLVGNRMFMTLGNLEVDPRIGVLVLDWERGTSLQLSGRASVSWEDDGRRWLEVAVEAVVEQERALPLRWEPVAAPARGEGA